MLVSTATPEHGISGQAAVPVSFFRSNPCQRKECRIVICALAIWVVKVQDGLLEHLPERSEIFTTYLRAKLPQDQEKVQGLKSVAICSPEEQKLKGTDWGPP